MWISAPAKNTPQLGRREKSTNDQIKPSTIMVKSLKMFNKKKTNKKCSRLDLSLEIISCYNSFECWFHVLRFKKIKVLSPNGRSLFGSFFLMRKERRKQKKTPTNSSWGPISDNSMTAQILISRCHIIRTFILDFGGGILLVLGV